MNHPVIGTYDFYFDAAEALQRTGAEFTVLVRHPGTNTVMILSNVSELKTAIQMTKTLNVDFGHRFQDGLNDEAG